MKRTDHIEVTTRALVVRGTHILLCRSRGSSYYFLPGGHVEFSETAARALGREFREEFGVSIKKPCFIGACENVFRERGVWHHELIAVFTATTTRPVTRALESHLEACWIDRKIFSRTDVRPHAVRDALVRWMKDKKTFWTTEHPGSRR